MDCSCAHHIGIPIFDKRFADIGKPQDVTMTTDFGSHLKQARKLAGLTQVQLAKKVGISQSTLAELERHGYGSAYSPQIAQALHVSATWLATGDGPGPGTQAKIIYSQQLRAEEKAPDTWPFKQVDRDSVARLPPDKIATLEAVMLGMGAKRAVSETAASS